MNHSLPFIFAILAGLFTTLEASINSKLGVIVTPKIATLHSLITGAVLVLIITILKGSLNQYSKIIFVSPQLLIGGIFGFLIIYLVTKTIPQIGLTSTLTLVISSQMLSSLFIDVFINHTSNLPFKKIIGVILLVYSTYLVIK